MTIGKVRNAALLAALLGVASLSNPAFAAGGPETFGPGKVACERLDGSRFDCLLTSLRINQNGNDVATFAMSTLPDADRAIFQKWCSTPADDCTVRLRGAREAPGGSRLSTVTSVFWTRLRPPNNQAAARASP